MLDAGGDSEASRAAGAYCQATGTPLIRTEVAGTTARVWTVLPGSDASYPLPATPSGDPVFASVAATVAGALAAGEALRILVGEPLQLREEALIFEAQTGRVTRGQRGSGADCPHCAL